MSLRSQDSRQGPAAHLCEHLATETLNWSCKHSPADWRGTAVLREGTTPSKVALKQLFLPFGPDLGSSWPPFRQLHPCLQQATFGGLTSVTRTPTEASPCPPAANPPPPHFLLQSRHQTELANSYSSQKPAPPCPTASATSELLCSPLSPGDHQDQVTALSVS